MIIGQQGIEIHTLEDAEFIKAICPAFQEADFEEELKDSFFLIGFPEPGKFALVPPQAIKENWEYITPGLKIKLLRFVR